MSGATTDFDYVHGDIRCRNDNMLVQIEKPPEITSGGVILPQRNPSPIEGVWARVIDAGDGPAYKSVCDKCGTPRYPFPMGVRDGDRVLLDGPDVGNIVNTELGECRLVRQAEVLAVEEQ